MAAIFKKPLQKDYGRLALLCFLVVGLRAMVQVELPILLNAFIDLIGLAGWVFLFAWIVQKIKDRKSKNNQSAGGA